MKFVDEATIRVEAGAGGDGSASFRREKYVPRGGPDGGDGGDGGSVFLEVATGLTTLADFRVTRRFKAESGDIGRGRNMTGRSGEDLVIPVPAGTMVYDQDTGELLGEVVPGRERLCVAQGGFHGLGNTRYKSSTNRAPRQFTKGTPGESRNLRLELRLLADVGLVGLPNAGKSTFLAAVSRARPKIADYPFTTLHPHLGIVEPEEFGSFTMVDVPGLIDGAAQGAGLGIQFLRHLRRTRILLHLVSLESEDLDQIVTDVRTIGAELREFDAGLAAAPRWLVFNKCDLMLRDAAEEKVRLILERLDWTGDWALVSALGRDGTEALCRDVVVALRELDAEQKASEEVSGND